jgi:pimeloyl-ACP methyl ester carboxylesterase
VSDYSNVSTTPQDSEPQPQSGSPRKADSRKRFLLVVICFILGLAAFVCLRPVEVILAIVQVQLWQNGIRSEYTTVDGYRIHYYVGGEGSPIVLVHGLGARSEEWASLMTQLAHAGHRVYAPDLLGYGRSARPHDASYSVPQEAQIVEDFMAGQHVEKTGLAGWSMGGWIAMRVALDEPARIRRLAIYDTAGMTFQLGFDPALFWFDTPEELSKLNDVLSPGHGGKIPWLVQQDLMRLSLRNGWINRRSMESMLTGADLIDGKAADLTMPLLIVWGRQDQLIPVSAAYKIHALAPQSVLEIYDGCGHLAPRECAGRVGPNTVAFFNAEPPMPAQVKEYPASHNGVQ